MKKIWSTMLAVVMVTGALTGCGGSGDSGASGGKITVISREDGSGTRDAFVEITGILEDGMDNTSMNAVIYDGTGKVMTAVSGDPNGLGYISLGSLNDTVKALDIDGASPTAQEVKSGSYELARPFNIATAKGGTNSEATQEFIEYIFSSEGQTIAENTGFIAVTDGYDFKSDQPSGIIAVGGSTSVYPLMEKLKEGYEELNPNVTITIESPGSSGGMKGAIDGTFDIGMASRDLSASELESLDGIAIALDGIAMIVNNKNELDGVTMGQIKDIYTDAITTFEELSE